MEQAELRIEIFLYQAYGPLISSKNIWHVLCYPSLAAYQQARLRGDLPVNEFSIEGRVILPFLIPFKSRRFSQVY